MPTLTPRYATALSFAAELHRDHLRKGTGIPYVTHLLAVSSLALENGADEDEAIAGLLHDAVEDRGGASTAATISLVFGERVAAIVVGCSDSEDGGAKPPWRERKTAYLQHLGDAGDSVRLVSACDKLHNARCILSDLRDLGAGVWERFTAAPTEILWYYRSLVAEFARGGQERLGRVVEELDRVVDEIARLAGVDEPAGRQRV